LRAGRIFLPCVTRTAIKLQLIGPTLVIAASRSDLIEDYIQYPRKPSKYDGITFPRQRNLIEIATD
jgi:hypothetical protein